jgi:hypothetical protein
MELTRGCSLAAPFSFTDVLHSFFGLGIDKCVNMPAHAAAQRSDAPAGLLLSQHMLLGTVLSMVAARQGCCLQC